MIRGVVDAVASHGPVNGLPFEVGGFVYTISWGGFYVGVAEDAERRRSYARFLRGKHCFR